MTVSDGPLDVEPSDSSSLLPAAVGLTLKQQHLVFMSPGTARGIDGILHLCHLLIAGQ